jgi:hypothetical protein
MRGRCPNRGAPALKDGGYDAASLRDASTDSQTEFQQFQNFEPETIMRLSRRHFLQTTAGVADACQEIGYDKWFILETSGRDERFQEDTRATSASFRNVSTDRAHRAPDPTPSAAVPEGEFEAGRLKPERRAIASALGESKSRAFGAGRHGTRPERRTSSWTSRIARSGPHGFSRSQ